MSDSVICASCGARIRANRPRCLRCGEPLQAAPEPPAGLPAEWLASANAPGLTVAILVLLGALVAGTLWWSRLQPANEVARPAVAEPRRPASVQPALGVDSASEARGLARLPEPVTSLDANRAGSFAFRQGDFPGALARFELAVEKEPRNAEALNNLGLALERLGRTDEAAARYLQAATLLPESWAYRFNYAHALGALGRWDTAIAEYRRAAELFPDDYATQYNLGMALHTSGDDQSAIPVLERATALAPSEPSFHIALGICLEKIGRTADAEREFRAFIEMAPAAPEVEKLKAHLEQLAKVGRAPG
jgi:Flp pilus assembly protein TadD